LAPFVPMYDAAVALLPVVEAYVNTIITPVTTSALAPLHPIKAVFTPDEARSILDIRRVK